MKRKAILLFLLIMISFPARVQAGADTSVPLQKANEYYLRGDYPSAQHYYRKVLDSGIENGKVYYNLGNTLFRIGKIGEAIRHYLLARQLIPRDQDLAANLAHARHAVADRIEPSSSGMIREIFFWYDRLSVKEMIQIFLTCYVIFWLCLLARLFSHRPATNWLLLLSLGLGIAMGGTAAFRTISSHLYIPAVVIVQQVAVQSGMDPASVTLFVLRDGAEVSVERMNGDWFLISLASGEKGWVKKEHLGLAML
jgi:tetratricopeptide (TPR) repeat protein